MYEIPPEQVVGTASATKYEYDKDGKPTLFKEPKLMLFDDFGGKAEGIHLMYLVEVKTPAESRGPWDYNKIIATIPGDQAFRRAGEDGCPLIKR